jgi:hypothetical protein
MKPKAESAAETRPKALAALKRAAKKAIELARRTNTAAYVLEDGKLVDISKRGKRKKKDAG